jgi:hypothetical protein
MVRPLALLALALMLTACAAKPAAPPPIAPQTSIPPSPARGEPSQYLNMAAPGLEAALGHPNFVRQDGLIQMWRYDGQACRAFFFLYGQPLSVRHVETLPHGQESAADSACLTALRAATAKSS